MRREPGVAGLPLSNSPSSSGTFGRKKFGLFRQQQTQVASLPSGEDSLLISEWSADYTALKLREWLDKPYRGSPVTGRDLMTLVESEMMKRLNVGKAELWKIADFVEVERKKETERLETLQMDLTNPPLLPEEDNAQRAKEFAVRSEETTTDSMVSRLVSDIFRSESLTDEGDMPQAGAGGSRKVSLDDADELIIISNHGQTPAE